MRGAMLLSGATALHSRRGSYSLPLARQPRAVRARGFAPGAIRARLTDPAPHGEGHGERRKKTKRTRKSKAQAAVPLTLKSYDEMDFIESSFDLEQDGSVPVGARRSWLPWNSEYDAAIFALSGPALLSLAADPLLSFVDTAWVGRMGSTELAALGVDTALFSFAFVVFNFLATATTPIVAQAVASGNTSRAGRVLWQAMGLSGVLGVAVMGGLFLGADGALDFMGAVDNHELRQLSLDYLYIRALAAPAVLMATVANGAFVGLRDTKTPLYVTLGFNALNFFLDPLLIFGFGWGMKGAAGATTLAEWVGAFAYGSVLWKQREELGLWPPPGMSMEQAKEMVPFVKAGSAMLMRTLVLLGAKTYASAVCTRLGTVEIAAHQVAIQLWMLASLSNDSLAVAGQALVAVELGGGRPKEARQIADRLLQLGLGLGVTLGAAYAVGAPALMQIFTDDPEVLASSAQIMPLVVAMQPLNAIVYVMDGILVGAGDFSYIASAMLVASAGSP
mmetsp:Transcript_1784/g.6392  ORF Transcript_1784/g.6392 Transcript_1784/m.6392 type:complete len:505 (-) Transcript_1784:520-2034(-)